MHVNSAAMSSPTMGSVLLAKDLQKLLATHAKVQADSDPFVVLVMARVEVIQSEPVQFAKVPVRKMWVSVVLAMVRKQANALIAWMAVRFASPAFHSSAIELHANDEKQLHPVRPSTVTMAHHLKGCPLSDATGQS
jgi:hypothetical protein